MVLNLSPIETEILVKLALATGVGVLIGLERQLKYSPAGIKTYSIIGLGSCLFTIIAGLAGQPFAGGIVSGVGFLGAGAIFRSGKGVHGLTTASLIWISAALGMAIGFGYYAMAVIGTLIVYSILLIIGHIEKIILKRLQKRVWIWVGLEKVLKKSLNSWKKPRNMSKRFIGCVKSSYQPKIGNKSVQIRVS